VNLSKLLALPGPSESDEGPATMKGSEPLFGYGVAAVLVIVAVLDLTITTGSGAPKHHSASEPVIGLLLAGVLAVSLRWRNRLVSPFIAIFAAFFVTLAKAPSALSIPHIIALVVAVGFAVQLSVRQRRDQKALGPAMSPAERRAAADARRRRRKGEPEPAPGIKRPPPNARYTPPKSAIPTKSKSRRPAPKR
jgi:hypothetical protein